MNQSKINAGGINQQPMDKVTATIANSININVQHLQAIHKASTSNERKINISALSININADSNNIQCTEYQHAKHSVFISKAHSVSVLCTLRQQPMCSQSTANAHSIRLPYAWFLQSEYFHSVQYASYPCHSAGSRRQSCRIHPPTNNPAFRITDR